ncbi:hypothetical protein F5Y11DRAFT_185380 [Daldinia sp. FL1419]|nr:hypothetical protein F5Y11DRAFT_185380 [Daldinia sp. FL1419]
MKIVSLLFGALSAVSAAATGVQPVTTDEIRGFNVSSVLPEGYTAVPFSMDVALEPGGEKMTFNGTVTEILAQIQSIKPDFTWNRTASAPSSTEVSKPKLNKSNILCKIPGQTNAYRWVILGGYDFLVNINQDCKVDSGPRKCAMLYCLTGNSIWMCNDNKTPISRSCSSIASYVLDIIGTFSCTTPGSMGPGTLLQGQEFDTDGFNVLAGGGGCE